MTQSLYSTPPFFQFALYGSSLVNGLPSYLLAIIISLKTKIRLQSSTVLKKFATHFALPKPFRSTLKSTPLGHAPGDPVAVSDILLLRSLVCESGSTNDSAPANLSLDVSLLQKELIELRTEWSPSRAKITVASTLHWGSLIGKAFKGDVGSG